MSQDTTFSYRYSAKENSEVQEIRKKYLPQSESKLEELKRLDRMVQNSGMLESLCIGVGGFLLFGLGICLAVQVIGNGVISAVFGVLLSILSAVAMFIAYPVYRLLFSKTKKKYVPRILQLTEELSGEKIEI